jgi:hypothetical protein
MNFTFWQLASIVALVAIYFVWRELETLRTQLGAQDLKPKKDRWKAFNADRRTPRHKPDQIPQNASDGELRFYRDFAGTADYLNMLYEGSPFSFENTGKLEQNSFGSNAAREIKIWHGQLPSGNIEISCGDYSEEQRHLFKVRVKLSLVNSRFMSGHEVHGLAIEVSRIVAGDEEDQKEIWAQIGILRTMVDAMWRTGEGSILTPFVDFEFAGLPPEWFLRQMEQRRTR